MKANTLEMFSFCLSIFQTANKDSNTSKNKNKKVNKRPSKLPSFGIKPREGRKIPKVINK